MDNAGRKEANEILAEKTMLEGSKRLANLKNHPKYDEYSRDIPKHELFHFDGWGYDGMTIKFETQRNTAGRQIESTIDIAGGKFRSSGGNTVIRVEDTEEEIDSDPEYPGHNRSHASLVLRFAETQYGSTFDGQHVFSGVLVEALTYSEDIQEKLDYGTPLEEILYSEDDPLELNPPDAGVLAHLVGKHAWISLYRAQGFRSNDYEPRRSVEEDLRANAEWKAEIILELEEAEYGD